MKEFIKKLIERLEEELIPLNQEITKYFYELKDTDNPKYIYAVGRSNALTDFKYTINQLAEEYNVSEMPTGWIPCSERLPKDDSMCLVTVEYSSGRIEVNYGWFDRVGVCWYVGMHEFRTTNVHAWMPLPPAWKGEHNGET